MQEKIHPTPVWVENDADYKDIRIDLYVDPTNEGGDQDLSVRFSFPKDGAAPYMVLILGDADLGEIKVPEAYAAKIEAQMDKAVALFKPYFDGERAFPVDLEAALEAGVENVQALVDARLAGTSMVEASMVLEDWAVAAADRLPDEPIGSWVTPPVAGAPDFDTSDLRLERGDVAVILEYIGEGADGDYDPTDTGDEPLMRIAVERRVAGAWEYADDSSYCTHISARASRAGMALALEYVIGQVPAEGSVKRLMERMSWIELTTQDGDSPDFSRVPA